ncbi:hypothetical protein Cgig2_010676 [Carnegiea gigantea]|uniref:Pentatricopeptide repeat-containing protein n=1 Tax=Carnegiea gigantea TaxID=171969 RepID=A0A9Q1QJV1_9CARY|nr:hypothetical protein Cgig2_010676 [Carnegiea gigantea]
MVRLRSSKTPYLNQFSNFSTVAHWNSQIREAVNNGCPERALVLYRCMRQTGLAPDKLTFPFVAKACAKISDLTQSQIVHAHILKSPIWSDVFVGTAVVDMYVKCDHLEFAYKVFEKMPRRDVTLWNAMLLGLVQSGFVHRFSLLFRQMRVQGTAPDSVTIIGLTQYVTELKDLDLIKGAHAFAVRVGMLKDVSLVNTLISAYGKCADLISAEGIFHGLDVESRTIVSWNSLIAGNVLFENHRRTFSLYKRMCHDGLKPDISTFLSLLCSCVKPEALPCGQLVHSHVIQLGCDLDVTVSNTLLNMYAKCGDIGSARHLFQNMAFRTCVSWTAMITGHAEKGELDEAFTLFSDMQAAGEKPDVVTLLSLLSGCGQTGSLELGRWLDNYALSNRLRDSVIVCNALIDMYAKCGSIGKAKEVFHSMPSKSIVSWTTMIAGLALNGEFSEALDFFFRMVELGLKPNHITFLSVLQACTHAGFLDKGRECFDLMAKVYKLNPWLEHYSCMVDLLGRRGKLKEALDFIKTIPLVPDAGIWGALLAACKIHHNLEIGEYAAHHLYELEPKAAVSYVEMANMYASAGRWDGVSKARAMMRCNEVKKSPGQSLVQVDGKNHIFSVEERCHPAGSQIYEVLNVLVLQLKGHESSYLFQGYPEDEIDLQQFVPVPTDEEQTPLISRYGLSKKDFF